MAPKNESYVINVLRFLGVIDDSGKKVETNKAFVQHKDEAFAQEFGAAVRAAYEELFELHGDAAWDLDKGALTQFFRTSDHSSDVVGTRQAITFSCLAGLSGRGSDAGVGQETPAMPRGARPPQNGGAKKRNEETKPAANPSVSANTPPKNASSPREGQVGLTVRIEVNLPANGDQETYDRIFKSIRKNLIDGEQA